MKQQTHSGHAGCRFSPRWWHGLVWSCLVLAFVALAGVIAAPSFFAMHTRAQHSGHLNVLLANAKLHGSKDPRQRRRINQLSKAPQLVLASWGHIGGCGVSGAASSGGAAKWIGRGVSGGLVNVQCMASQTFMLENGAQSSLSTRVSTSPWEKWSFATSFPMRFNVQDVDVYGQQRTAYLPGWGDLGVEVTRKLGITNASSLTLALGFPTGSHDAVREGIVLPQSMQMGNGTLSGALTYEYNQDYDWGLMVWGLSLSHGGFENSIGDVHASSASGYLYAGYLLGPFVSSLGVSFMSKFWGDRERYARINDQPMVMATLSPALEWSSEWIAVLLAASLPFSPEGLQSWGLTLGVQTSVF